MSPTILALNMLVKMTAVVSQGNQASLTSWYYRIDSVGSPPATDQDAATASDALDGVNLLPVLANTAYYHGIIAQIVYPLPIINRKFGVANAGFGTGGANPMPAQACGITEWVPLASKRGIFGRAYWPFPSTSAATTSETPSGAYTTALGTLSAGIQTRGNFSVGGRSCGVQQVIFHRAAPASSRDVLAYQVHAKWATQKRRGDYGRTNISPI